MSDNLVYALNEIVTAPGSLGIGNVKDEGKIRYIVTGAGPANVFRVRARVNQSPWVTLVDLTGSVNEVVDVFTYDQVEVLCLVYDTSSDVVRIFASSFDGSVISVDTPSGSIDDFNTVTFTSSDNSVQISADPLTGEIDFVAVGGGGGGTKYPVTFNATTDWSGPTLGYYSLSIPFATHAITNPDVEVLELVGADYEQVYVDEIVDTSNNITIKVTQSPDLRFAGKIIIS